MSRRFLHAANRLFSFLVTLCLVTAMLYAGYALWDNGQIYASAENGLSELTPDTFPANPAPAEQGTGTDESGMKEASEAEPEAEETEEKAPAENTEAEEAQDAEETEMTRLFNKLWEVNEDIGAWIIMPGTAINYPVVRGQNNIQYISTDIYGNFAIVGSIFLDSRNQEDYSDTYNLLYGHNMTEHRMFSDVNLYKEEAFFNENQKGYLYLPTGAHWLQSISIIVTPASNSWMMNPQSWANLDAEKMLELVQTDALFVSGEGMKALQKKLEAEDGERPTIVALSTCSNEFTDARTILLTLMDPEWETAETGEAASEEAADGAETGTEPPAER